MLSETGYEDQLRASRDPEDEERLANIQELLTVAREFDERHPGTGHLEAFLEETTLVNDTDDWETTADRVTLMTLHASKGLEFPVVYIVAVEEGLLPHERSRDQPDQLEEERRLLFVGITRAQQELQLSMAQYRDFRGLRKLTVPSSFLMELPRGEMTLEARGGAMPLAVSGRWGRDERERRAVRRTDLRRACLPRRAPSERGGSEDDDAIEDGSRVGPRRPARSGAVARRLSARHVGPPPALRPGPHRGLKRQRHDAEGDGRFFLAHRAEDVSPARQPLTACDSLNDSISALDYQIIKRANA